MYKPTDSTIRMFKATHFVIAVLTMAGICTDWVHAEEPSNPKWRYTMKAPSQGWQHPGFDDSGWKLGIGGFGARGTPGSRVGTTWKTNDIWIRRSFAIAEVPSNPGLLMHHDEDAEVFINGVKVASLSGYTSKYELVRIAPEHRQLLKQGANTLAVHCHQSSGGQFIDVHVVDADNPKPLPALQPFKSQLITQWGSNVTAENAWTEYPRPQMQRNDWQNLNGYWDYAVTSETQTNPPRDWEGKILVPFCLESKLERRSASVRCV